MTYGWLLTANDGDILAQGNVPCNGKVCSLRSEGTGMLAGSLLLGMAQEYAMFEFYSINLHCIADNLELINRGKQHGSYTTPYPNQTLKGEFDLTEQTYCTQKYYKINAK